MGWMSSRLREPHVIIIALRIVKEYYCLLLLNFSPCTRVWRKTADEIIHLLGRLVEALNVPYFGIAQTTSGSMRKATTTCKSA